MRKIPAFIVTDEEEKFIQERTDEYRKYINSKPELLSLLYDIDLLPEQIRIPVNVGRMIAVCELFKMTDDKENKTPDEQT